MFERGANCPKSYLHVLWTSLNYTSWSKSSNDHLAFSSIICLAVEINLIYTILEWMLSWKPWLLNMKRRENKIFNWETLCKPKRTKPKHAKSKIYWAKHDLILCFREIEELKSGNKGNDNASTNQIEALRMELDQKEKLNSSRIRELEATVKKLEKENSKLKENEVDPPQTEDIGTVYCYISLFPSLIFFVNGLKEFKKMKKTLEVTRKNYYFKKPSTGWTRKYFKFNPITKKSLKWLW